MKNAKKHSYFFFFLAILWLGSCLLLPEIISAQALPFRFKNISEKEGLPNHVVFSLLQDKKGFIWIGTEDGLCRYDGLHFQHFRISQEDSNSLSGSYCRALWEDKEGNIWIGLMDGGLNKYLVKEGKFVRFPYRKEGKNGTLSEVIFSLTGDKNGNLWIASNAGLSKMNLEKGTFTHYKHSEEVGNSLANNQVRHVYCDKKGRIWACTGNGGLDLFDEKTNSFRHFGNPSPKNQTNTCYEDAQGNIWVGTIWGIALFSPEKQAYIGDFPFAKQNVIPSVYALTEDKNGNIWVGTNQNLHIFDTKTQKYSVYAHNPELKDGIGGTFIRTLMKDEAENIWIGSAGPALSIYLQTKKLFHTYYHQKNQPNSLDIQYLLGLSEDNDGNINIGSRTGWAIFSPESHTFQHFLEKEKRAIHNIFQDENQYTWLSTHNGLDKLGKKQGRVSTYGRMENAPNSLAGNIIIQTVESPTHTLWLSISGHGINSLNPKTGKIKQFPIKDGTNKSLNASICNYISFDKQGKLWIGTDGDGLFVFDTLTEIFVPRFLDNKKQPIAKVIMCILPQENGIIWLGTYSGLYKYDSKNASYQRFTEKEGLANNAVNTIVAQDADNFWISTNKGLSHFQVSTQKFRNYDISDGLLDNCFNIYSGLKSKKGVLYFGSMNGLVAFRPEELAENKHIPKVAITEIRLFNSVLTPNDSTGILRTSAENTTQIELNYRQNFLSFAFAALDYAQPEKNQYAYKMEEVDADWVYCGTRNFANYADMKAGRYVFRVKAANNDGIWNEEGTQIIIIVRPPFWATWWFRVLMLGILGTSIYLFYQYRINQIRKSEQQKAEFNQKIADLSLKALRSQMNPHFIFNSLNAIDKYILMSDELNASVYLNKFARLMRMILVYSEKQIIPLKQELEMLEHYIQLENLRMEYPFSYKIECSDEIDVYSIKIPSLLLQPYIENSVRHGLLHKKGAGNIWVFIDIEHDYLHCTIEDDGIGREKSAEIQQKSISTHISQGMKITQDRLKLLNTNAEFRTTLKITDKKGENGNALGTKVELWIPI